VQVPLAPSSCHLCSCLCPLSFNHATFHFAICISVCALFFPLPSVLLFPPCHAIHVPCLSFHHAIFVPVCALPLLSPGPTSSRWQHLCISICALPSYHAICVSLLSFLQDQLAAGGTTLYHAQQIASCSAVTQGMALALDWQQPLQQQEQLPQSVAPTDVQHAGGGADDMPCSNRSCTGLVAVSGSAGTVAVLQVCGAATSTLQQYPHISAAYCPVS
jgi:hypothetical protein